MAKASRRSAGKGGRNRSSKPAAAGGKKQEAAQPAANVPEPVELLLAGPGPVRPWRMATNPIEVVERRWRNEIAPMATVVLAVFLLYVLTSPRSVTLEDDGLFLMNLATWGVCHPPGYPLYSLLGSSFYHLLPEFIAPALRGHLFSGFCAAIACGAIYAIVIQLVRSRVAGVISGLALGASDVFWSQAIIAEVYSLNAMMFFIVMALCLRYSSFASADPSARGAHLRLYGAIAFVYGLGLSNHWPLMGLGSIGLLLMVLSQLQTIVRRLPLGAVCLVLGLLPYTFLVWRSQTDAQLNFYGPLETLESMRFYVTRGGYSGVDNQEGVGLAEKLAFTRFLADQFLWQFSPAGLLVAFAGFIAMLRSRAHSWLACCLLVSWFMASPLMIILINFQDEFIWFSAFRVYHLLAYGITAIWLGYGIAWLTDWMRPRLPVARAAAPAGFALGALIVAAATSIHWERNDRSGYYWARDLAMFKLVSVEPGTHLFTFDDLDLPVGYMSYVEGVRTDVAVYNDQALVFGNRLYSPFLSDDRKVGVLEQLSAQVPTPVYYHPHRLSLFRTERRGSDFLGFWRRVNRDGPTDRVILSDTLLLWLENALDSAPIISDRWTRQQNYGLIATLVSALSQASQSGYQLRGSWNEIISRAYRENPLAHLVMLWGELARPDFGVDRAREELAWIESVRANPKGEDSVLDSNNYADMLLLGAQIALRFPDAVTADANAYIEQSLRDSIEFKFKDANVQFLVNIYRGQQRWDDAIALIEDRFPRVSEAPESFRRLHLQVRQERDTGNLQGPVIDLPGA